MGAVSEWLDDVVRAHLDGVDGIGAPFVTALREIEAGRKQSHWSWYVFPQAPGLGHSPMSRRFAVPSDEAAVAFLEHPVTGPNYLAIMSAVITQLDSGASLRAVLGAPDDAKFMSSLTLMQEVATRECLVPAAAVLTDLQRRSPGV
ncbi:MAG: hypothetical protein RLZZ01_2450 [Actinomycetota bacterium]